MIVTKLQSLVRIVQKVKHSRKRHPDTDHPGISHWGIKTSQKQTHPHSKETETQTRVLITWLSA